MVRQENIETASTVTSIIPASTVNSDHNSTIIIAQNNQPEPISSALISLDISNTLQKAKNLSNKLTTPQEASVDIYKASQKAYNNALQHKEYQILADLWKNCINSYLTVRKFLGHPKTCNLLNGWNPKMMLLTAEWRKSNPPPPKQVPKTAPVGRSSNSNVKKQPQDQNKGKGKAPATKPYSQGYRIPNIQQDAMENVFEMARKMMEIQKKEEARLKYQK
ncbi:hypothetical protein O181_101446 [Austropuccinia psidii MF-1]|uniref:No apical meristem-associated C-terminal domain-containing protein n=1 Tax=Austropuccinia psidii MF-1 TaxID=1389203 RepID=A0A9Q3JGQ8_9BASI|nr:hypothetical protein [Austropuccinia psidii MF-1]